MENIEKVLEKLMINRTKLMLNRFDKELKDIIESDLQISKLRSIDISEKKLERSKVA